MHNSKLKKRFLILNIVFILGIIIFLWGLGSTGLVDETPPLFAAAGRAMSETGDWITPKVNGILRFDKPPLFYWFMGMFYSLPGNQSWDKLGSLSARLPSAISSLVLMLLIADTLFCFPQRGNQRAYSALIASLGFALSPLVIIWSRTAVSDALLCATIGISLLLFWRRIVTHKNKICIAPWIFLGLAILTKGPVAFILIALTLFFFFIIQKDWKKLLISLNPIRGLIITSVISLPWYLTVFLKEGKDFFESFFGYHNLQRYTSVVNNHSEPWWFFVYILIIGSLPFSGFLFQGVFQTVNEITLNYKNKIVLSESLYIFAFCWLLAIFLFFSISATKLPSYWLPATPAVGILISRCANLSIKKERKLSFPLLSTTLIFSVFLISFFLSDNWLVLINDPEMPDLASQIKDSGLIIKARFILSITTFFGFIFLIQKSTRSLFYLQIFFLLGQLFLMDPVRNLADTLRQLPIRNVANEIRNTRKIGEPLAMIGIRKPSLHFYSRQIVFYEPNSREGLINLSERLNYDKRKYESNLTNYYHETILLVIDRYSRDKDFWKNIKCEKLGQYGIYNLIRLNRNDLDKYALSFRIKGYESNWRIEKFENF